MTKPEKEEFYTKKEVAKLLGIAESTVYKYAEQGKIQAEDNPFRIRKEAKYLKSSVDNYLATLPSDETGISISEVAKKFNESKQRIYQIITKNDLKVNQQSYGKRVKYLVPIETQNKIKELISSSKTHKGRKSDFYSKKLDIALFQLFKSHTGEVYRMVKNSNDKWGITLSGTNNFIAYEQAVKELQLQPLYSIHQSRNTKSEYAEFELLKSKPSSFTFLDYVYKSCGIENIYVKEHSNMISIFIKQTKISLDRYPLPETLSVELIENFIVEGAIFKANEMIHIVSNEKAITMYLKLSTINQLNKKAQSSSKSISQMTEEALQLYFSQEQNN